MSYLPKRKTIWLLFDANPIRSNGDRHYVWWFDTLLDAMDHREWIAQYRHAKTSKPFKFMIRPEGTGKECWVLFDLTNGHNLTKRYCWWFDTLAEAETHLAQQRSRPHSANLSEPVRLIYAKAA